MSVRKSIIIKSSLNCNLRCKYCYEFGRSHTDVHAKLDIDMVENFVNRIANLLPDSHLHWLIHGGEPFMLGIEYYKRFFHILRSSNEHYGTDFQTAIQTNGTLLNEDWIELFDDNSDILSERILSISIDGPKSINDSVRIMQNKKSCNEVLIENFDKIRKTNLKFTTLSVIGRHNVDYPDVMYNYIRELNPLFSKFIPCYNFDKDGNLEKYGISPIEFANYMCIVFDLWLKDEEHTQKFRLDPIMTILSKLLNIHVTWCEYRTDKCENFITIFPNGDIWLCDVYNQDEMKDEAYLGNMFKVTDKELIDIFCYPEKRCTYRSMYNHVVNECENCDIKSLCNGGCVTDRFAMKKHSQKLFQEYCEGKHILINHIKNAVEQIKD